MGVPVYYHRNFAAHRLALTCGGRPLDDVGEAYEAKRWPDGKEVVAAERDTL